MASPVPQIDLTAMLWQIASGLPWWVWPLAALVVVLRVMGGGRRRRRVRPDAARLGAIGEQRVARILGQMKVRALHDVLLPAGRGATQIDHIALVGDTIVSIETKNWSGSIFGTAGDSHWTQSMYGRGNQRHLSPLRQNDKHIAAVKEKAGYRNVVGLVVMTGKATFPNGWPEGVIHIGDLAFWLNGQQQDKGWFTSPDSAWKRLEQFEKHCDRTGLARLHQETITQAQLKRGRRRAA